MEKIINYNYIIFSISYGDDLLYGNAFTSASLREAMSTKVKNLCTEESIHETI